MKGKLIVFEGIDGSGKSSQIRRLQSSLQSLGNQVKITQEPTDLPIGKLIRKVIQKEITVPPESLAALFAADRLDHIHHKIEGMIVYLEEGTHILCDRYYFSSLAYHSLDMHMDWVVELNRKAMNILKADVTIFLDVTPEQGMERIGKGRSGTDLFEKRETLREVRRNYVEAFGRFTDETILWLDGARSELEIADDIWSNVRHYFSP